MTSLNLIILEIVPRHGMVFFSLKNHNTKFHVFRYLFPIVAHMLPNVRQQII